MANLDNLFENNKAWSEKIKQEQPDFFEKLSKQQSPEYLWIGCADSRVSADQLMGLMPGEVFVHRNIANQVIHTDLNCLSVIQYAVEVLKVKHVIVCGHYGCGGVAASLDQNQYGLIDNWLRHISDVYRFNKEQMEHLEGEERVNRLCELNVVEQVANVANTTTLINAWESGQKVTIHGFIYNLKDGVLQDLDVSVNAPL
ncbi:MULTISPECIES: carbonate dehydratase [unclassified Thalassotalea]|uniref:carbonate dehydratase n=1 Tax=unclassified Thalassotalea TaxID=2614972 RepID=UPI0010816095|nr:MULTISPECIES: carbonate dehydratase [unclassified Thalassotalea]NMP17572.1 carbonate dehydratase [Thalassotalea sp. Y01]QBY05328.1 carbonate dehydratase [Thalassotalea sp. HSM 43]